MTTLHALIPDVDVLLAPRPRSLRASSCASLGEPA